MQAAALWSLRAALEAQRSRVATSWRVRLAVRPANPQRAVAADRRAAGGAAGAAGRAMAGGLVLLDVDGDIVGQLDILAAAAAAAAEVGADAADRRPASRPATHLGARRREARRRPHDARRGTWGALEEEACRTYVAS